MTKAQSDDSLQGYGETFAEQIDLITDLQEAKKHLKKMHMILLKAKNLYKGNVLEYYRKNNPWEQKKDDL